MLFLIHLSEDGLSPSLCFVGLPAGGKRKLRLRSVVSFTLLVNMTGDVGHNAYKQTQLFRQNKFAFDEYPFSLKLTLRKSSVEVDMEQSAAAAAADSSVPVRVDAARVGTFVRRADILFGEYYKLSYISISRLFNDFV